ncbi:hypothetical protein BABINDRAFT_53363 [Babjeviella inositovora NRRL Y-12698]|uniref:Large ribosomal subunit protein uL30-like ferredoxin-like fold domain-containing protein n=1 Tax=Babjeviella inositovora NRRL Y-12698 TaxID=984486 RepID=A0A1E3QKD4_9ASCO|nr:uncharacterized protein BABINDRAFT_53363 [Babjeviella inositovora NRRL Y-12698]ODQ78078.1 hypothetical protein BABINDRAFT_53363 [Babjeviella inositovora NRRL Y-12698]
MFYRIVQKRSTIGLPRKIKDNLVALGLGRPGLISYQAVAPAAAGKIAAVKELVEVELRETALTKAQEKALRKSNQGFVLEKVSA